MLVSGQAVAQSYVAELVDEFQLNGSRRAFISSLLAKLAGTGINSHFTGLEGQQASMSQFCIILDVFDVNIEPNPAEPSSADVLERARVTTTMATVWAYA